MKWIHRDEKKPEDGTKIVICTDYNEVAEDDYGSKYNEVQWADTFIPWEQVIGWMPSEQFPHAKEEDFE